MQNKEIQTPILMFHGIEDDEYKIDQNKADKFYTVNTDVFRSILDCIKNNNQKTITSESLNDTQKLDKSVCITFDDGIASDYLVATPILNEYNMHAVFFIVTDWIEKVNYLSKQQVKEMHSCGMDIQIHGKTHEFLTKLNNKELFFQLQYAKNYTEDLLSKDISSISFPGGRGDNRVISIAKELGYKNFFSSRPGWFDYKTDDIPRYVIHQKTSFSEAKAYLSIDSNILFKRVLKYKLSRFLFSCFGENLYNKFKLRSK